MALIRPPSQKLQEESFIAARTIVNEMNCEFIRQEPDNAGIDGEIKLVQDYKFTGKLLKFQIKAGLSYLSSESKDFLKVRVEKKYIDIWSEINVPVILFFYHPDKKRIYWKSVQDYLRIEPNLLKKQSKSIIIPFDKHRDRFCSSTLTTFKLIIEQKFEYEKVIYTEEDSENIIINLFRVKALPQIVFFASTDYRYKREITNQLNGYYSFILKERKLLTFSDLSQSECELRNYCNSTTVKHKPAIEIDRNHFVELLNSTLMINALKKDLIPDGERFYFSPNVLKNPLSSSFTYRPLRRQKEQSRAKIYIRKIGNIVEYQHHSLRMRFNQIGSQWYFEIEPDWFFSYPYDRTKTKKDIGIRITKEKANMFNGQYLYLLHAWKQFLSDNSGSIKFLCDDNPNSQCIDVDAKYISYNSRFMLFNDYSEPKMEWLDR